MVEISRHLIRLLAKLLKQHRPSIDTVHIFSFNAAQCSLFWGMSKGQESKFLAVFDLLNSSSEPQKPQHKSGQKFISLGAKNKMTMFYHIKGCLDFLQGIDF